MEESRPPAPNLQGLLYGDTQTLLKRALLCVVAEIAKILGKWNLLAILPLGGWQKSSIRTHHTLKITAKLPKEMVGKPLVERFLASNTLLQSLLRCQALLRGLAGGLP